MDHREGAGHLPHSLLIFAVHTASITSRLPEPPVPLSRGCPLDTCPSLPYSRNLEGKDSPRIRPRVMPGSAFAEGSSLSCSTNPNPYLLCGQICPDHRSRSGRGVNKPHPFSLLEFKARGILWCWSALGVSLYSNNDRSYSPNEEETSPTGPATSAAQPTSQGRSSPCTPYPTAAPP